MNAVADRPANPSRRRGITVVALAVVVGIAAWFAHWWLSARHVEHTDDAYVAGHVVQITAQLAGTVLAVRADDTQRVKAGDVLVELDPADAQVALQQAEADLARSVRDIGSVFARGDQLHAQIAQRRTDLDRVRADLKRRQALVADGGISGEELSHARDAVASVEAALSAARAELAGLEAQTSGTTVETHPSVQRAAARIRELDLALSRTQVLAPVDGVVARRSVQAGQRVNPGVPMMAVVPLDDVWVDANFKESQLQRVHAGQAVTLHADVYGDDVVFHGSVQGLGAGTGAAFALLPAQNASGNWIKVVQRVPVRIALDPAELAEHPLRVGLSMQVEIDIAADAKPGTPIVNATGGPSDGAAVIATPVSDVEDRITRIITANHAAA